MHRNKNKKMITNRTAIFLLLANICTRSTVFAFRNNIAAPTKHNRQSIKKLPVSSRSSSISSTSSRRSNAVILNAAHDHVIETINIFNVATTTTDSSNLLISDATATLSTSSIISAAADAAAVASSAAAVAPLSATENIVIFVIGIIPFGWATVEFWRRIAVGESFGTGKDSVVFGVTTIGENEVPESSRGKRVLGQDALIAAYILFTIAAGIIGLVLYSVISSGTSVPMILPSDTAGAVATTTLNQ